MPCSNPSNYGRSSLAWSLFPVNFSRHQVKSIRQGNSRACARALVSAAIVRTLVLPRFGFGASAGGEQGETRLGVRSRRFGRGVTTGNALLKKWHDDKSTRRGTRQPGSGRSRAGEPLYPRLRKRRSRRSPYARRNNPHSLGNRTVLFVARDDRTTDCYGARSERGCDERSVSCLGVLRVIRRERFVHGSRRGRSRRTSNRHGDFWLRHRNGVSYRPAGRGLGNAVS